MQIIEVNYCGSCWYFDRELNMCWLTDSKATEKEKACYDYSGPYDK